MNKQERERFREKLQELVDEGRMPDPEVRAALGEDPELSAYWRGLNELQTSLRKELDRSGPETTMSDAVESAIYSAHGRRKSGIRTWRGQRGLAAAALILAAGLATWRIDVLYTTRQMVRTEVSSLVSRIYSPDFGGLGTVTVPVRLDVSAGADSSYLDPGEGFVDGVMNSVATLVDPAGSGAAQFQ